MESDLQAGLAALTLSRKTMLALAEDVPDDKLCHQPFAGANHVLWNLGHIAWTDDYFLASLCGAATGLPPGFAEKFSWGTTPTGDARAYPPRSLVLDQLAGRRESLVNWLRSLTPTQLAAPTNADLADFAPTFSALPAAIAWHEGFHTGQIAVVRKSLGMKPKMG